MGIWHVKRHGNVPGDKHRHHISSVLTAASVANATAPYSAPDIYDRTGMLRFTKGNLIFNSPFKI